MKKYVLVALAALTLSGCLSRPPEPDQPLPPVSRTDEIVVADEERRKPMESAAPSTYAPEERAHAYINTIQKVITPGSASISVNLPAT